MGQYGAVIGGVVGAVVGFFAGGNVYAGWMIGSAIGGAYSASQQVIPGPKIGDVSQQTSQEGVPRPIVFGRSHPIAGNIICDGGPRIVRRRERQGKGGPKVESESAYRTYAVGVCEGPITAFLQVWKNNQLVYDIEDPSMIAENAEFLRYARFFLGSYEQMPSPDLESIKGAGNVSTHRGTAYMVLKDEDVTDQRGMWSQWTFRVARFPNVESGTWWAVRMPESSDARPLWRADSPLEFDNSEERGPPTVSLTSSTSSRTFERAGNGNFIVYGANKSIEVYGSILQPLPPPAIVQVTTRNVTTRRIVAYGGVTIYLPIERGYYYTSTDGGISWIEHETPEISGDLSFVADIARLSNGTWVAHFRFGPQGYFAYTNSEVPSSWSIANYDPVAIAGVQSAIAVIGNTALAVTQTGFAYQSTGGVDWTADLVGVNVSFGAIADSSDGVAIFADTNSTNVARFQNGSWQNIPVGRTSRSISYGNGYWVLSGDSSTGDILYSTDGGITWNAHPMPLPIPLWAVGFTSAGANYKENFYPLSLIVSEICERSGVLGHIDVSDLLDKQFRGLTITNQYPAYGAIQTLSQCFFFDPSNVSGEVRFVRRGKSQVAVVTEDEMVGDGAESIEETRRDTLSIPRVLHLNYYDVQGGLNTDKQISERPEEPRANGEQSLQTPVILSADEAATVVWVNHGAMAEMQKGELNFNLPDKFIRLTESDPIIVQWEGKSVRGVIAQLETDDGEQRYKVYRDRQSLYSTIIEGIPAAPVSPTPSRIAGPTLLQVIDIPIIRDADDRLGFYIAVSGIRPAWQGAFIEASFDGGETWEDGERVTSPTVMGSLSSALGDHPQEFPDYVNTASIVVQSEGGLLSDSTLAGMMNRRNLAVIGDEVVNFASVDETSEGIWSVSQWLRGRKGTQPQAHEPGTRFVMLDGAIFVPADLVLLGRTITFRATSFGRPVDESTIATLTFTGQSQRERAPTYVQAYQDGVNAFVSWQGVGRLGGGVNVAMGAFFAGYRVVATDGVTTNTYDVITQSTTVPLTGLSGAVTIFVQQRNSLTGLGPSQSVTIQV